MNDDATRPDAPDFKPPSIASPLAAMLAEAREKGLWLQTSGRLGTGERFEIIYSPDEMEQAIARGEEYYWEGAPWRLINPAPEIERRRLSRVRDAAEGLLAACKWAQCRCVACKGTGGIDVKEYDSASGRMEITGRTEPCRHCGVLVAAIAAAEGGHKP